MATDGMDSLDRSLELIVILGNRLNPDCSPSEIFQQRLEKGAQVYAERQRSGDEAMLMVSGGKPHEHEKSEAEVGIEYLIDTYVPGTFESLEEGKELFLEEVAKDSITNAIYLLKKAQEMGANKLTVVTSDYHTPRVSYIFCWITGTEMETSFIPADSGFSKEELRRHLRGEHEKILDAAEFFTELNLVPGEYEEMLKILGEQGGYLVLDHVK